MVGTDRDDTIDLSETVQNLGTVDSADTVVEVRLSQILAGLGIDSKRPLDRPGQQEEPSSSRPMHLGRFLLQDQIGRGGMGRVFEARDPELRRTVAIKVLLDPKKVSAKTLARFVSEAQITSQLDHPNIIPIHEVGATHEGEVYFVMKKVEGRTLTEILADARTGDTKWTQYRLLNVFIKICNAVAYAHDRGVLHRDLKPANIMLGRFGEVLVMDWGVARLIDDETEPTQEDLPIESTSQSGTVDGASIGTPGYMSPEQAQGQLEKLGPTSDVWSLGSILYQMLTLRPAYEADDSFALVKKALKPPVPPNIRAPECKLDREIEGVCLKALQPEPEDRYDNAAELARTVEEFLEGSKRRERRAKRARVRRRITAISLSVLALVALSTVMLWRRADVAREQADELRIDAELSEVATREALIVSQRSQLISDARHRELTGQPVEALALFRAATQLEQGDISALAAEIERLIATGGVSLVLGGDPEDYVRDLCYTHDGTMIAAATWHWAVIWDTETGERLTIQAHDDLVRTVSIGNDSVLATGSNDGSAALWDLTDGSLIHFLNYHTAPVIEVFFDPSGERVATVSEDGTFAVWSTSDGTLSNTFGEQGVPIINAEQSPDGMRIASVTGDGSIWIWELDTGRLVTTLTDSDASFATVAWSSTSLLAGGSTQGRVTVWRVGESLTEPIRVAAHQGEVTQLGFNSDGSLLASGGMDGVLSVCRANSGELLYQTNAHEDEITELTFLRDDEWLVTAGVDGTAKVWSADSGVLLRQLVGHEDSIDTLDVTTDGSWLATGSSDTTVRLWALREGALVASLRGHDDSVEDVWFSTAGSLLASVSTDGEILFWDDHTFDLLERHDTHQENTVSIQGSPRGHLLATFGDSETIHLITVADGTFREMPLSGLHPTHSYALAFSPDESLIAAGAESGHVPVFRTIDGQIVHMLEAHYGPVFALAFSPDGRWLATGSHDDTIGLWDVENGELLSHLRWHGDDVEVVKFNHNGTRLFSASSSGHVCVWSVPGGQMLFALPAHHGWIEDLVVSPDGTQLATGGTDKVVRLWDSHSGALLHEMAGLDRWVRLLFFSPDGLQLASASSGPTIHLWNTSTGQLGRMLRHPNEVTSMAYHPNGELLATGAQDGLVRIWRTNSTDADTTVLSSGGLSNLRVCRDDFMVIPVLPFPEANSFWAPNEQCEQSEFRFDPAK